MFDRTEVRIAAEVQGPAASPAHAGYRALACAVINAAVHDAKKGYGVAALDFLTERNPVLDFWCGLAGLDMNAIVSGSRRRFRTKYDLRCAELATFGGKNVYLGGLKPMPKRYTTIRDALVRRGMPLADAKTEAAKTYNKTRQPGEPKLSNKPERKGHK